MLHQNAFLNLAEKKLITGSDKVYVQKKMSQKHSAHKLTNGEHFNLTNSRHVLKIRCQ